MEFARRIVRRGRSEVTTARRKTNDNAIKGLMVSDYFGPGDDRIVVRFWARSPDGARAQFKVGGGDGDSFEFAAETEWIALGEAWKQYEIDVTKEDLSALRFAFVWVMDRAHNDIKERTNRRN